MNLLLLTVVIFACYEARAADIVAVPVPGGISGSGFTTHYWDCCKPACASRSPQNSQIVNSCEVDGSTTLQDAEIQSGCVGGPAYSCSNQVGFAYNETLALGFTAASLVGGADVRFCCACVLLTFKGVADRQMIVQITNTGGDLGENQFDLAVPGGGVGLFTQGCVSQWHAPQTGWGAQYGGVGTEEECSQLPVQLQEACKFRFEFIGVDNPDVDFVQVECPAQLITISGCERTQ